MNKLQAADNGGVPPTARQAEYIKVLDSDEFQDLRKRYRGWVLPVTVAALVWYFSYVLLAAYAPDVMGRVLFGHINLGLVLGLAQFVTTFTITSLYVRYADRVLDPRTAKLREELEANLEGKDA